MKSAEEWVRNDYDSMMRDLVRAVRAIQADALEAAALEVSDLERAHDWVAEKPSDLVRKLKDSL